MLIYKGFVECCFITRAITLPISPNYSWPRLSDTSELDIRDFEKTYGILWIMTKCEDTMASDSALESRIFFSTSEYAQVPPCAANLFAPLAQQLLQVWDRTFQVAESRLAIKVRETRFDKAPINHRIAYGVAKGEWKKPELNSRPTGRCATVGSAEKELQQANCRAHGFSEQLRESIVGYPP